MLRKSTNQISIRPKVSSPVKIALLVGILGSIGVAVLLAFNAGVRSGNAQIDQDRSMLEQLNSTILNLRTELSSAREDAVIAQRHRQIQEEAYKQISAAYAGSEQKNQYLGSRLDFYRSIISPEDGQTGPAIQALDVKQSGADVSFDVTLVQAIKHKQQIRGKLTLEFYMGDEKVGQWPESGARNINFQYFQNISGIIEAVQLAKNARMRVELTVQDGDPLEKWFNLAEPGTNK
jgi:hypothetical protein